MSNESSNRWRWNGRLASDLVDSFQDVYQALLLVSAVLIAIAAIGEIVARQQFLALIESRIQAIRVQYVELSTNPLPEAAVALESATESSPSESEAADRAELIEVLDGRRLDLLRLEARELGDIANSVRSLVALGAERPEQILRYHRTRASFAKEDAEVQILQRSRIKASRSSISVDGFDSTFPAVLRVSFYGTDLLLALAVISCGVIGALVAGIRAAVPMTTRNLSLGLAAGFVAFLAIKGGKHLFLIQVGDNSVAFNPYSSAFAGLLAGLFTERAYLLLSSIVDDLIHRLQTAMSPQSTPGSS